jgi:hypothetical protein
MCSQVISLTFAALLLGGCRGNDPSPDFKFIDDYLATWDRFAQGANELAPRIRRDELRFQRHLATALTRGDRRAPSRLVFYAIVQVGGFIAHDAELGRACERLVGRDVSVFPSKKGERMYFAGDLYFWWQRHQEEFDRFPLYEEWRKREFAQTTAIPMYEQSVKKR